MKNKLWIKILLGLIAIFLSLVFLFNYIMDPYGLYKTNFFPNKPIDYTQARIVKLFKAKDIDPLSIVIGTSRADLAIDPEHRYFKKPSYNLSIAGASLYEIKYYIKEMILEGNVKDILLVLGWRMFNKI